MVVTMQSLVRAPIGTDSRRVVPFVSVTADAGMGEIKKNVHTHTLRYMLRHTKIWGTPAPRMTRHVTKTFCLCLPPYSITAYQLRSVPPIIKASGGVNLPKWTSSCFWSISARYTVTVHSTHQFPLRPPRPLVQKKGAHFFSKTRGYRVRT